MTADDPHSHAILSAWRRLDLGPTPPRLRMIAQTAESRVYRLGGAGPAAGRGPGDVIAKLSSTVRAKAEMRVYECALAKIGMGVPAFHGIAHVDGDRESSVLFLSYVDGEGYAPSIPAHASLASEYLARLHTRALQADLRDALPTRSLLHYEKLLDTVSERLQTRMEAPGSKTDRAATVALSRRLTELADGWERIACIANELPASLVHTRFAPDHVRVDASGGVMTAFGWCGAAWGPPCLDLGAAAIASSGAAIEFDVRPYARGASGSWADLTPARVTRQVIVGKVLHDLELVRDTIVDGDIGRFAGGFAAAWARLSADD